MTFTFIDLALVVLVLVFVIFGLYFGLIHTLGSLIGALIAIVGAGYSLAYAVDWLSAFMNVGPVLTVIVFIVLFLIISRLIGFAFWVIERAVGILTHLPFISSLDHLLGGILGFLEGLVASGVLIHVALTYLPHSAFTAALNVSAVGDWISSLTGFVVAWLPF
jgi:uncharacterized membrane protein required for colicin V production